MGSAGQLARSFLRPARSRRGNERLDLPDGTAWVLVVVAILCRSVLSTIVALLLWSVLPTLVGFQTTTVMSGSMTPRLHVGDAVVIRHVAADGLARGQVLLFDDPDHPGRLRLHRLVDVQPDGRLVTRGDANADDDSSTVAFDAVRGAAFLRIPASGLPNYWLRTGQVAPLCGSALLVLVLLGGVRLGMLLDEQEARPLPRRRGVRLPPRHRAATAGAVLVVLSGGLLTPAAPAEAAYSDRTAPAASTWGTTCTDVAPVGLGTAPRLYWGYGTGTGASIPDLSGQGDTGVLSGDATRATCAAGASPFVSVGSGTGGAVVEQTSRTYPGDTTVATWFKTSTAGGVLADFGSSGSSAASSSIDRVLYLRPDGSLTFGGATIQVAAILSAPLTCTSRSGLADDQWHLVVATWSLSTGCTLTVDNGTAVTSSPTLALALLGGYPGYWRFGYDVPSTISWPGVTPRFVGGLDESQVYGAVLDTAARRAIWTRGH